MIVPLPGSVPIFFEKNYDQNGNDSKSVKILNEHNKSQTCINRDTTAENIKKIFKSSHTQDEKTTNPLPMPTTATRMLTNSRFLCRRNTATVSCSPVPSTCSKPAVKGQSEPRGAFPRRPRQLKRTHCLHTNRWLRRWWSHGGWAERPATTDWCLSRLTWQAYQQWPCPSASRLLQYLPTRLVHCSVECN